MLKRSLLAIVAIFIVWSALDIVVHGLLLGKQYEATAELWRPMDKMHMGTIHFAVLLAAIVFVTVYARFFAEKNVKTAVIYGLLLGLSYGYSMGYCTYAVMPIPQVIALVWFLGTVVEMTLGGLLLGWIVRESPAQSR